MSAKYPPDYTSGAMPIYEFVCMECEGHFEELLGMSDGDPSCPGCGAVRVIRQFSVFAAGGSSGGSGGGGCACGGACACGR